MTFDIRRRAAEVLKQELETNPEVWYYVSFAEDQPIGFKGAVIIKAHGITDALTKINALNINPHGQVLAVEIPDEHLPDKKYHNKLLQICDVKEFWPDAMTIGEIEALEEKDKKHDRRKKATK